MMMFTQCIFVSLLTTQVFSDGLSNRIVGSSTRQESLFYQVALVRSSTWGVPDQLKQHPFCGGSIINERWILTAAYCVYGISTSLSSQIKVLAGAYDLSAIFEPRRQIRYVSSIHIHPSYPGLHSQHDIALLKLNEPIYFTEYVRQIFLPNSNASFSGEGYISGWGSTSTTDIVDMPNILHCAWITIISYDECKNIMKQINVNLEVFDTQLCTGSQSGIVSTCIGDSGNPLIRQIRKGTFEQVGIVSWGLYPCGSSKISSVYTRVSHYISWINEIMSRN